jgi:hypothetical protein
MNGDLILPPLNERQAIVAFAASFNGYEFHGSFAACADAAKAKRREVLEDLRNELFFAYRAGNHLGDPHVLVSAYAELLPHFERMLAEGTQGTSTVSLGSSASSG